MKSTARFLIPVALLGSAIGLACGISSQADAFGRADFPFKSPTLQRAAIGALGLGDRPRTAARVGVGSANATPFSIDRKPDSRTHAWIARVGGAPSAPTNATVRARDFPPMASVGRVAPKDPQAIGFDSHGYQDGDESAISRDWRSRGDRRDIGQYRRPQADRSQWGEDGGPNASPGFRLASETAGRAGPARWVAESPGSQGLAIPAVAIPAPPAAPTGVREASVVRENPYQLTSATQAKTQDYGIPPACRRLQNFVWQVQRPGESGSPRDEPSPLQAQAATLRIMLGCGGD